MKNRKFFYLQYDNIKWENQEKTKINAFVNNFIIKNIFSLREESDISFFDIGFGIGFFLKNAYQELRKIKKSILLEGCEPSKRNFEFFSKKVFRIRKTDILKTYNTTFLHTKTKKLFDYVTAIYVFPHFIRNDLDRVVKKIYKILKENGKFVLVVAEEEYLSKKLNIEKDLFIEETIIMYRSKRYKEILHHSEIPKIGKVIDFNREEIFYEDLFKKNKFKLLQKKNLNDNGFICTVFVFEKK